MHRLVPENWQFIEDGRNVFANRANLVFIYSLNLYKVVRQQLFSNRDCRAVWDDVGK